MISLAALAFPFLLSPEFIPESRTLDKSRRDSGYLTHESRLFEVVPESGLPQGFQTTWTQDIVAQFKKKRDEFTALLIGHPAHCRRRIEMERAILFHTSGGYTGWHVRFLH